MGLYIYNICRRPIVLLFSRTGSGQARMNDLVIGRIMECPSVRAQRSSLFAFVCSSARVGRANAKAPTREPRFVVLCAPCFSFSSTSGSPTAPSRVVFLCVVLFFQARARMRDLSLYGRISGFSCSAELGDAGFVVFLWFWLRTPCCGGSSSPSSYSMRMIGGAGEGGAG